MKINQIANDPSIPIQTLAGACQDIWHYAALIKPPVDGRISTFEGSRGYRGLKGKIVAYESLKAKIDAWQIEALGAFVECQLPEVEQIQTEKELVEQVGYAIHALNLVCQANNIDGYTGSILPVA